MKKRFSDRSDHSNIPVFQYSITSNLPLFQCTIRAMVNFIEILIRGLMLGSVYALVGMGLTLVWGVVGIVNIAHGEFVMLGAYFAFWAFSLLHLNPLLSVVLSIPVFFLCRGDHPQEDH